MTATMTREQPRTASGKRASGVSGKAAKPLRIRPELLPDSAKYATIDDEDYVMIPVRDFGEWYEDVEDGAIAQHALDNPEPLIPAEQVKAAIATRSRRVASRVAKK